MSYDVRDGWISGKLPGPGCRYSPLGSLCATAAILRAVLGARPARPREWVPALDWSSEPAGLWGGADRGTCLAGSSLRVLSIDWCPPGRKIRLSPLRRPGVHRADAPIFGQ